jgi:hypothetical protein
MHFYSGPPIHLRSGVDRARGTFWIETAENVARSAPGDCRSSGVVGALLPNIINGPVVFLSVDTPPKRDASDIIFVNRGGRHAGELHSRQESLSYFVPQILLQMND